MPKRVDREKILQAFLKDLVILCPVFIVLAFLFAFSPVAQAYSSYTLNRLNSNTTLHYDSNGVYITSFSGNTLEIDYINNSNINKRTLKLQGEVKNVATNNGIIYAISKSNNTLYLNRYVYSRDTLNSFIIEADAINSNYKFAIAGDRMYFAESEDYNQIACHSIYGEKIYSFYLDMVIDYRTDNNGILYICCRNQLYTVDTTTNAPPKLKLDTISLRGDIFLCDNTAFDYSGNIINLQNGLTISTNIISSKLNAAVIDSYYCKYSQGAIYSYSENGTAHTLYNINAGENAQMCYFNGKLYILSDKKELYVINQDELEFPQNSTAPPTAPTSHNTLPNTPQPSTPYNNQSNVDNTPEYTFSINNYYIDNSLNIIWNIPNGTTLSEFKNNLTYSGYSLEFYNSNMVKKTSGKIGTGFTMIVKDTTKEHKRYTISVKGDLSGDGNINRSDVTLLSNYLMSSATLTNEQYTSADTNADNIINGVDVLKIARNNL